MRAVVESQSFSGRKVLLKLLGKRMKQMGDEMEVSGSLDEILNTERVFWCIYAHVKKMKEKT